MRNKISKEIMQSRLNPRTEDLRGPYFRDQTAIIHSGAFRRLKHKTQAFFAPQNDHICTRIEHVLHVATIAETICKGLNNAGWQLDTEIAYAAGIGHDLGHAPFGHSGEKAINQLIGRRFEHEINSLRVVDKLSNEGHGINLTFAVRDGILSHCGEKFEQYLEPDVSILDLDKKTNPDRIPATWEGCAVRFADKIAYFGRDIEDALTAHIITRKDIPERISKKLGRSNGEIINTLLIDLIENTAEEGIMGFSDKYYELMVAIKDFNYKHIYTSIDKSDNEKYCIDIIKALYHHLRNNYEDIVAGRHHNLVFDKSFQRYVASMDYLYNSENADKTQIVIDYVSGMTDNYALASFKEITLPKPVKFY